MVRLIKNALLMVFFFLVTACVSTPPPSPLSSASVSEAVRLINSSSLRSPDTTPINDVDQRTIRVKQRLMFPIRRICNRNGGLSEKKCGKGFEFSINIDDDFNAYAHGSNNITLNSGLIRRTVTDEELAFVLAHEAGHHIANHLTEDKINSYLGELVGGVLMGAMTVGVMSALGVECDPTYEDCSWLEDIAEESVNDGMELGNEFAVARYSREQEFEADRIASDIIKDANMSIAKVIPLLAYMGNLATTGRFSEFGDSHPSGVERLGAFLDYNPESSQPSPGLAAIASDLNRVKSRGVNSAASKSKDRRVDSPTAGSDSLRIKSSGYGWVKVINASGKEVFSKSAYKFSGLVLTSPPLTISLGVADSITLLYGGNPLDFQRFVDKSGDADFALCPDGSLVGNVSQCSS